MRATATATATAAVSPLLAAALDDSRALANLGVWTAPCDVTLREADRLLKLLAGTWPMPQVLVQPTGAIALEWEAGGRGWLVLTLSGTATLEHAAVIDGDEYGLTEDFVDAVPDWARELLRRLLAHPVSHS